MTLENNDQASYDSYVEEINKRLLNNSEKLDQAILTLATATLGFSLAFLKDFVPAKEAFALWLLVASWFSLVGAIALAVVSFLLSEAYLTKLADVAHEYYISHSADTLTVRPWDKLNDWIIYSYVALFIAGLFLTTIFVTLNLQQERPMSNSTQKSSSTQEQRGQTAPVSKPAQPQNTSPSQQPQTGTGTSTNSNTTTPKK